MTTLKWLPSASLAVVLIPALYCEPHCPGNAQSIPLRSVGQALIEIPVMLDGKGPYGFLVDTGAQITSIDTRVAAELGPRLLGTTYVTGVGTYLRAEYAQLHRLQAGSYAINDPLVLIRDLTQMGVVDRRIGGILGDNFLEHYDLLIDYRHHFLCLDDTRHMQAEVPGEHVPLTPVPHAESYLPFTLPFIVSTRVFGMASHPLLLQLDSGIDRPLLFEAGKQFRRARYFSSSLKHKTDGEFVDTFAALEPQNLQLGHLTLKQISFVTLVTAGKAVGQKPDVDGVLPTALFRKVFISYAGHFAILRQ